jgi:8-oxo-dGTP pyrophosphatase MutT (NUDIX family)
LPAVRSNERAGGDRSRLNPVKAETAGPVLAAGGVVWRRAGSEIEVVIVHRGRYDDWSLPKGKLDPGESDEEAALREVQEETTIEAALGPELPSTTYLDRSGKHKRVRYWAMTVVSGDAAGAHEVDDARWVTLDQAAAQLSYPHDVEVVEALTAALRS